MKAVIVTLLGLCIGMACGWRTDHISLKKQVSHATQMGGMAVAHECAERMTALGDHCSALIQQTGNTCKDTIAAYNAAHSFDTLVISQETSVNLDTEDCHMGQVGCP